MNNLEKAKLALKNLSFMNSDKKIIVIAGNHEQFEDYVRGSTIPREKFVYASSAYDIMGIRASEVILYGTYEWRKDVYELRKLAESRVR